jgi:hypothetical protein
MTVCVPQVNDYGQACGLSCERRLDVLVEFGTQFFVPTL